MDLIELFMTTIWRSLRNSKKNPCIHVNTVLTSFCICCLLFWGHCDVTPQVHISCDVTSPLLIHTNITQCILKENKENTNVQS